MARKPVYSNKGFQNAMERFKAEMFRRNPIAATALGEHKYDGLLPEVGADAMEKEIAFWRDTRDAILAIPRKGLSLDEELDVEIIRHASNIQLFLMGDIQRWKLGLDLAMILGDSIFMLFVRDFAPLALRTESMIMRLKSAPAFLMSGRTLFQRVPPLWAEIFLDSAGRVPGLFDSIEESLKGRVPQTLFHEFRSAAGSARQALDQHCHWLKHAILPNASGDWAMGEGAFQGLLGVRNLGLDESQLLEIGESALANARQAMETLARKISGAKSFSPGLKAEVHERLKKHGPATFEQALAAYRDAVARCRAFVETSGFATVPPDEVLEVVETPGFMAHLIPFAAYLNPEPGTRPQKGIYFVTRGQKGEDLSIHNYADISNTSVHEGYPGHHLQLSAQNLHPSPVRIFSDSIELIEGWAHYCEEETKRMGFEAGDENRFIQANDAAMRAARVLIDVNINRKSWDFQKGIQVLIDATGMAQDSALAEMKRYTQSPGYQLSYTVGKVLLVNLKEELKKRSGSDFRDRDFHDLVINEGSLPIFLAREFYPRMLREIPGGRGVRSEAAGA